jgi:hypothetical protein
MPKRSPVLRKVAGKVAGAALNFVPGGAAVKGVAKLAGGLLGSRGAGGMRKRRSFSVSRLQKRLISAKINAKITRVRLSAFKGL